MRLVRIAAVGMLTDALDFEDDDGKTTRVAQPNSGYYSASGYSSHNDVVYRWKARLHRGAAGPVVVLETREATQDRERTEVVCYARLADGSFVIAQPSPDLTGVPVVSEASD